MTCYQYVVSGGSDGMLKVWDRLKLDPVSSFVAHLGCEVAGIAVWEGTIITVGTDDRRVRIHDMTPWLITAIDRVDMFYMWRVLKSITSTPARVEVALTNLVRHYRFSASVVFVEHFLTLGVPISDANLAFMRVTNTHERLAFLQYLDADGDGSVSDADLVTSLQVPLAAARAVLCRVMSVEVPPVGLQRAFQCPKLSTDALYARLAVGSLSLKRLVVAAGAHWLYSNRRVPGQCFRLFGVSGVVSMVTQYLHVEDMTAVAVTCHDCNSVSTLGIFWRIVNFDGPRFPLERYGCKCNAVLNHTIDFVHKLTVTCDALLLMPMVQLPVLCTAPRVWTSCGRSVRHWPTVLSVLLPETPADAQLQPDR